MSCLLEIVRVPSSLLCWYVPCGLQWSLTLDDVSGSLGEGVTDKGKSYALDHAIVPVWACCGPHKQALQCIPIASLCVWEIQALQMRLSSLL